MSIRYCGACDDAFDSDHHDHETVCKRCLAGISTQYVYPPIPIRDFDWVATFDHYDGAPDSGWRSKLSGHGKTEDEAIINLIHAI